MPETNDTIVGLTVEKAELRAALRYVRNLLTLMEQERDPEVALAHNRAAREHITETLANRG